jgi:Domain of unknown function (DUF4279)
MAAPPALEQDPGNRSSLERRGLLEHEINSPSSLAGHQESTFAAGASIRISGLGLDMQGISQALGRAPSHIHKQGELNRLREPYATDMWLPSSPLDSSQKLEAHLKWLGAALLPHRDYILKLREKFNVDIYCYKTCYTEQASLAISSQTLKIFTELDLKLGVSLIFLPEGDTDPKHSKQGLQTGAE